MSTKLKPFDLKAALRGEPVETRDGREVTQVTKFDANNERYCVAAVVDGEIETFSIDGKFRIEDTTEYDLFMATKTVKKEGWVNIYTPGVCHPHVAWTSHIYGTEREARSSILPLGIYISTVKIEWEEEA